MAKVKRRACTIGACCHATITSMNRDRIRELLEEVQKGRIGVDEAANRMSNLPYEDIAFARVDHHRDLRLGFPEVILGQGRSEEHTSELQSPYVISYAVFCLKKR